MLPRAMKLILVLPIVLLLASWATGAWDCSEAICGPRVSKCMLLKSCNCSMTPKDLKSANCSCCKDCIKCLGEQLGECCSCVGLCPPSKGVTSDLKMRSVIEDLPVDEHTQGTWDVITSDKDTVWEGWTIYSFPALEESNFFYKRAPQEGDLGDWKGVNCTVIYSNKCMSSEMCAKNCQHLGASSYRWFATGCCECVGDDCINYGSRVSRCSQCSDDEDEVPKKPAKSSGEL